MSLKYWLIKSEPNHYSIDDLKKADNQTDCWDGVRNYQARNFIRDDMKKGDSVLFYHSNTDPLSVVGYCEIVREAYPDDTAFNPEEDHYDPKSKLESPRWFMVDIQFKHKFSEPVKLADIKNNVKLQNMRLIKKGNRLSVMPITKSEWEEVLKMGES